MPNSPEPVVLVASAEFTLKSWPVRRTLEQRLIDDVRFALSRDGFQGFRVEKDAARLVVRGLEEAKSAALSCSKIFGVAYSAPATLLPAFMEPVVESIVKLATAELHSGQTFAIRAHRSSPSPLSRRGIELKGGSEVLDALKDRRVSVDLENPDVTFYVDLAGEGAYVYAERLQGPGGLPLSAQWKMLAVLDSGPLTILAAYSVMRRGCLTELFIPTSNTMPKFATENQVTLARKLRGLVTRPAYRAFTLNLDTIPVPAHSKESSQIFPSRDWIRTFATRFAREKKFKGIIFADVAGGIGGAPKVQPAASDLPIFTPLIGFDSADLAELAKVVGIDRTELMSHPKAQTDTEYPTFELPEPFEGIKVEQISL